MRPPLLPLLLLLLPSVAPDPGFSIFSLHDEDDDGDRGTAGGVTDLNAPAHRRKIWRRDALMRNADNWEGGAAPCAADQAVFPRAMDATAYVGGGLAASPPVELGSLVLPWTGSIALPFDGDLVFGGDAYRTEACPGKTVRWRGDAVPDWWDPDNWQPGGVEAKDREAVPHLARTPCGQDVAVFDGDTFILRMPDFPFRVGAITVRGRAVTRYYRDLLGFVEHVRGDALVPTMLASLPPQPAVDVASLREQCGLGAPQGTEDDDTALLAAEELQHVVCRHVTCPAPTCARPVRPHLHCCYVCGAVLELRPLPTDDVLEDVRLAVRDEAARYEARWGRRPAVHVSAVPSPTAAPGLAQVVVVGADAEYLAADLLARIREARGADSVLPMTVAASLTVSGPAMAPATVASVLGVLVGSLILVVIVMAVIVYAHEGRLPLLPARVARVLGGKQASFLFARFENVPGEDENGVVVNVVGKQQPPPPAVRSARGSWSARSFSNPLYEQESPEQDSAALRGVARVNPLFSELQRRSEGDMERDLDDGDQDADEDTKAAPEPALQQAEDSALGVNLVDITLSD